jgi:hypothetical protein
MEPSASNVAGRASASTTTKELRVNNAGCKRGGRYKLSLLLFKDKDLNLEEIEASHRLSGAGEGHVQGRGWTCTIDKERVKGENIYVGVGVMKD